MRSLRPLIAVTSGEPAGIGPELCATLAGREWPARLVILGDHQLLRERTLTIAPPSWVDYRPGGEPPPPGVLEVLHLPLSVPARCGQPDVANAPYVLALLDRAVDGCLSGEFAAMVTAPVHKGVINDAGIGFSGHTEYLAQRTGTPRVVMMLVGGGMRVALATTHLALAAVPATIEPVMLRDIIRILVHDLGSRFGLHAPRILVAGLNPHAGEGGHMGREEIEIIAPLLADLRASGLDVVGPLPADTLFVPDMLAGADAVLAMYHDQGLPVLKHASFGAGVNITLGLPIIRTSVDHGTAFDLAGTGRADPGSLHAALDEALAMIMHQRQAA